MEVLLPLVERIKPRRIFEIGTWRGYSAKVWVKAFNPEAFFTIDIKDEHQVPEKIPKNHLYIIADSHVFIEHKKGSLYIKDIDFLFIDGAHDLKGVTQDWEMYSPLVRKGGIIALHDVCYHADKTEEVDILWRELKQQYPYVEIKCSSTSTGIGVVYV